MDAIEQLKDDLQQGRIDTNRVVDLLATSGLGFLELVEL